MVGREPGGYVATEDPAALYHDVLVALDPERGINNGQPSLHALALHALAAQPGEDAVHVGCGTGYYSAILARLVGAGGHVEAIEIDTALAARAVTCLADLPWVFVAARNGTEGALPASDIIYVSAAAAAPARVWLGALREGGRLLFPLAPAGGSGGMLLVQRQGERLPAQFLPWRVSFIPCQGAQDGEAAERLRTLWRATTWDRCALCALVQRPMRHAGWPARDGGFRRKTRGAALRPRWGLEAPAPVATPAGPARSCSRRGPRRRR